MVPVQVRDWGEALLTLMTQALALFLAAIPKVTAFRGHRVIGWLPAALMSKAVEAFAQGAIQ
jgi:hypothetical protein